MPDFSLSRNVIGRHTPIREAAARLDSAEVKVLFLLDEAGRPVGSVTDGDLRRGILRGIGPDAMVADIAHANPRTMPATAAAEEILAVMHRERITFMALVDRDGRLVAMQSMQHLLDTPARDNLVVLMAGGLGQRLRPLTENMPKPMLNVGGRPLLETLVQNCVNQGFRNFCISVNYQAQKVIDYFGDGSRYGASITYIREAERLGTAGPLCHIEKRPEKPILVVNGDILTNVDFRNVLEFHVAHDAAATMAVREYQMQIPYGVVEVEHSQIQEIREKPVLRYLVNAGIYVLDPAALDRIPRDRMYDMTRLFSDIRQAGQSLLAFPLREYWLDIGQLEDFERANMQYSIIFGGVK